MDAFTGAIYDVAHEHGLKRLAPDLGVTEQSLRNKINPNAENAGLTLPQYYQMVRFTKQLRLVQPLLDMLGMVAVPAGHNQDEDASLCDLVLNHSLAFGSLSGEIHKAMADGQIDLDEIKKIKVAMQEELHAMTALVGELEGMAQPKLAAKAKA